MKKSNFVFLRGVAVLFLSVAVAIGTITISSGIEPAHADEISDIISAPGEMVTLHFTEDTSRFANPERGWYRSFFTDDIWGIELLRDQGISVIQLKVDLGDFLESPISESKLTEIRDAFALAKENGLGVIFRAAYDFTGKAKCEPHKIEVITGHIDQLESIFHEYESVLWFVQAGFLGPWGEWHSSFYGGTPSLEARQTILFALMKAVPESRAIQVRRPMFIRDIFQNDDKCDVTLNESDAFGNSYLARTGYHNDALLSTENEYGTYTDPAFDREAELDWVNKQTQYTPFAGETCIAGEYSDPSNAVYELDKLNAHSVHLDYHPEVIEKWKSTTFEGENTYKYISDNLGYRFVLISAQVSQVVEAGGVLDLNFQIQNEGFANLINSREVEIVLSNGHAEYKSGLDEDPRTWTKESGVMDKELSFSIPSDADLGNWSLYLNMPSSSEELCNNPLYSVRLANENVWDEKTGYNLICQDIYVISSE